MNELYLRRILWFGLSGIFLGLISRLTIVDLDIFHEMALFREVMRTGGFPHADIFSYLPTTQPVVHHEWGAGAILYFLIVKQGLGANGLLIFKYLITACICVGIYFFAKRQGASDYAFSFIALWGIFLGSIGFTTIRAQLFSLLFLVIFLFLIEENRKGKNWPLPALLPIYIIWVNIHGGFLIGLGIFGIYIFELFLSFVSRDKDFVKSLNYIKYQLAIFVIMCASTLINPYGIAYGPYIWHAVTLDRTPFIAEWRPIWQVSFPAFNIFLISLIILFYAWYKRNNFWLTPGTFLIMATAWLALWHYRHLSIYSVVFICYAPMLLEHTEFSPMLKNRFHKLFCLILICIGFLGIIRASSNKFWQLRVPTTLEEETRGIAVYPVGAVEYLRNIKFSGNVMVHYNVGAYVSWNLFPQVKVSMDSRFEVAYSVDQVAENMNFFAAKEGWQNTLSRYQTDALLVQNWNPIEQALSQDETQSSVQFRKVYVDDGYSIYMRSDLAEKYPYADRRGETLIGTFP